MDTSGSLAPPSGSTEAEGNIVIPRCPTESYPKAPLSTREAWTQELVETERSGVGGGVAWGFPQMQLGCHGITWRPSSSTGLSQILLEGKGLPVFHCPRKRGQKGSLHFCLAFSKGNEGLSALAALAG